jgi:metal transporter CNNM
MFSGLTLGIMSLELSALSVMAEAGAEPERGYAKRLLPLRRNGNLLLCTLLIGNVVVNSFLSILMADLTTGPIGLFISTPLIVIFGEIAPQAICCRHGLMIGAKTTYLTWACIAIFFVAAWPVSKVLDLLLGREVGTVYTRDELKHLIKLQVNTGEHPSGDGIDSDEHNLLAGSYATHHCQLLFTVHHHTYACTEAYRL